MDPSAPSPALSALERERLAALLAVTSPGRWWAVAHMHGPLLCALGLLSAPDAAYARAAQRRFGDPAHTRRRALALLDELDRDIRDERYEHQRKQRRRRFRHTSSSQVPPPTDDDRGDRVPRAA